MKECGVDFPLELKRILKDVSRTLYLSINILPDQLKSSMSLGYLVARTMDTVVDCPAISSEAKRVTLGLFRELENKKSSAALAALIKEAVRSVPDPRERALLLKFERIAELYASFPERELAVLKTLVSGVAGGMEMDLDTFGPALSSFRTEADLERYCALIGGEPGVFWARLYGEAIRRNSINPGDFPSETDASLIGSALQITNILKDMSADLRIGRCYLPQSDLAGVGLSPSDLLRKENMSVLRPVIYKWVLWAVTRLDLGEKFLASIPKTELAMRTAFIWPVYWAMDTLQEVAQADLLEPAGRPKIKRSRIYSTIACTPALLLSNTAFARSYRLRRETLIMSISHPEINRDNFRKNKA